MLGLMRFVFSVFVVLAHLGNGSPFLTPLGIFGVCGFYIISGYLLTLILNEKYAFDAVSYATNRFLKIFPLYFIVALLTLVVFLFVPDPAAFHDKWVVQTKPIDLLGNLLIFPFEFYDANFRIVPPTWSLAVELVNYVLLWLLISRNSHLALLGLVVGITYHVWSWQHGLHWEWRYRPFYAAMLPFSLGASLYFYRDALNRLRQSVLRRLTLLCTVAWLTNIVACGIYGGSLGSNFEIFFHVNTICLVAIIGLMTATADHPKIRLSAKFLGDLSYPIFLTHFIVAFCVNTLILKGDPRGIDLLLASAIPILVVSCALSIVANKWIEPLRNRVRAWRHT